MRKGSRKSFKTIGKKKYAFTGRHSWTKATALKRKKKAEKLGYKVKIVPLRTRIKRKKAYGFFAQVKKKGKRYNYVRE